MSVNFTRYGKDPSMGPDSGAQRLRRQELTRRIDRIRDLLTEAFQPVSLEVVDDSARHAGHAGASPEGETHFNVAITSEMFEGLSRVQVQRAVNLVLAGEFESGLHALSIKASAPPAD